jgi:hypothetical protein
LFALPWTVRFGNSTITEPPKAVLPNPGESNLNDWPAYRNLTRIVFSVPNGVYNFTIMPQWEFYNVSYQTGENGVAGLVHVNDHDVSVDVTVANQAHPATCF